MGLDSLIEQQKGWSVPDPGLRANLQQVILEDVVTVYREFWNRYEVSSPSNLPNSTSGRVLWPLRLAEGLCSASHPADKCLELPPSVCMYAVA